MIFYGVRSAELDGDPLGDVLELFLRLEDAEVFLAECVAYEPGWVCSQWSRSSPSYRRAVRPP